jgi:uncharacterized membrane protein
MKFKWILKWRGMEIPVATIIAFAICAFWSFGMILAPLSLPSGSVEDLTPDEEDKADGRWGVGAIDNADITEDMNPYAKFFYEAGDSQCHTFKDRSLFVNGNQMPFCTRDVGIFFGMTLGLLVTIFIRFELKWWWLIGGLVPIGIDGTVQLVTSYESTNILRMTTGLLAGLVTTVALGWVFYDISQVAALRHEEALEGPMGDYREEEEPAPGRYESPESGGIPSDENGSDAEPKALKVKVEDKT